MACYNWGTLLGSLKRHAEAEQVYRMALQVRPNFPQARLNLAHQLEHQGRIDEALAQWRTVADDTSAPDSLDLRLHALNNAARMLETTTR